MANEKTVVEIDTRVLDDLVNAGFGKDPLTALRNAVALAQVARQYGDDQSGQIYIEDRTSGIKGKTIAVHAFFERSR